MQIDIYTNLFLLLILALAVVGMVTIMNYLDRKIATFISNKLNKYRSKKRWEYNMELIRKRMNKFRGL